MKRISSLCASLLLLAWITSGCIVVNIERKPESGGKQTEMSKEITVTEEGDVTPN